MARSILVFAVVFCAVVCLMSAGTAQPPESPSRYREATPTPAALPGQPTHAPVERPAVESPDQLPFTKPLGPASVVLSGQSTAAPVGPPGLTSPTAVSPNNALRAFPPSPSRMPYYYYVPGQSVSSGDSGSLKQQFITLTQKRAERMTDDELKQGIAEMRREFLIAELKAFADESPDEFDRARVEIATTALKAKDMQDIQTLIRTLATKLEATINPGIKPRDVAPQPREGSSDDTAPLIERPE